MAAPLSDKAKAFLAKKPAMIGNVLGIQLYEHPERGDESPFLAIMPSGRVVRTPFWDLPSWQEAVAFLTEKGEG